MAINFWKILGVVGTLSQEVSEALADDGKISSTELLKMGKAIVEKLDMPMDDASMAKMDFVLEVVDGVMEIAEDGRVTLAELIALGETICAKLGIDLDTQGINLPDITGPAADVTDAPDPVV